MFCLDVTDSYQRRLKIVEVWKKNKDKEQLIIEATQIKDLKGKGQRWFKYVKNANTNCSTTNSIG